MPAYEYDTATTTYSQPEIAFPTISGLTNGGVAVTPTVYIPLLVTNYVAPTRAASVGTVGVIPIISNKGLAYGGQAVMTGNLTLPKVKVEGHIDTPLISNTNPLSNIQLNGFRLHYADLIAMYLEGRASAAGWERIDPSYFRDPYGRVFNNPRILDFNASYVEAVPGRTNFSLTLKV